MDCQDWTPVVIRNSSKKSQPMNKQNAAGTKDFYKLNEDDIPQLNKMTAGQASALREARNAKGLSQTDFAKQLNINVNLIKDYENGTVAKFNKTFYNSLMRKLGVKV